MRTHSLHKPQNKVPDLLSLAFCFKSKTIQLVIPAIVTTKQQEQLYKPADISERCNHSQAEGLFFDD